ncbi:hypothetical protein AVEN_120534-1 [Araneus ventricosus]|uniref:Nucleic-acid-binding protein from transposon X-element n=1 Tax=Araneus ventricosus TaxID=182803 RepID=A0A4Y2TU24_ARAVE|nr:hypothetical protein AVEN_120534-1 [Araneus ventricosus]
MCSSNPRCMKCAGPHKSKDCPKPNRDTQPKCLHCNGAHTANFTDCPKNPFNRKPFSAVPENAWSDRAVLAKIKAPPIPTVEPNATSLNPAHSHTCIHFKASKSGSFFQTNVQYDVNNDEFLLKPNSKFLPDEKSNC